MRWRGDDHGRAVYSAPSGCTVSLLTFDTAADPGERQSLATLHRVFGVAQ